MAGFLINVGRQVLVKAAPLVKAAAKEGLKRAPVIIKPAAQFTRGVVTGAPKYIPIAGTQGVKVATITPFLRAGIQTRQITAYVVKKAIVSGPVTAARVAVGLTKMTIRDSMAGYKAGVYIYQGVRAERLARGASTLGERALDRYIAVSGRYLDRFGLAPRAGGTVAGLARLAVYGGVARTIANHGENINDIYDSVASTVQNYRILADRILGPVARPAPSPVLAPIPIVVESPVVNAGNVRDNRPLPVAVPVTVSPRGAPVIYTPPRGR